MDEKQEKKKEKEREREREKPSTVGNSIANSIDLGWVVQFLDNIPSNCIYPLGELTRKYKLEDTTWNKDTRMKRKKRLKTCPKFKV